MYDRLPLNSMHILSSDEIMNAYYCVKLIKAIFTTLFTEMASTQHRMNHPHSGFMSAETGFVDIPGHNINDNNYDDPNMKTFYNKKSDSMSTGPYATTVLLRTPNDQVSNQRPINQSHELKLVIYAF